MSPVFRLVPAWLIFYPEEEGDMFLRNVARISTVHAALYSRKQKSS
jgi:hypothetical protein